MTTKDLEGKDLADPDSERASAKLVLSKEERASKLAQAAALAQELRSRSEEWTK